MKVTVSTVLQDGICESRHYLIGKFNQNPPEFYWMDVNVNSASLGNFKNLVFFFRKSWEVSLWSWIPLKQTYRLVKTDTCFFCRSCQYVFYLSGQSKFHFFSWLNKTVNHTKPPLAQFILICLWCNLRHCLSAIYWCCCCIM